MDQLTEDCIEARKAGMSYGKYMAMKYKPMKYKPKPAQKPKPEPKPEPKPKPIRKPLPKLEPGERACVICGSKFYTSIPHKLCCGRACSKQNDRERAKERAMERELLMRKVDTDEETPL